MPDLLTLLAYIGLILVPVVFAANIKPDDPPNEQPRRRGHRGWDETPKDHKEP